MTHPVSLLRIEARLSSMGGELVEEVLVSYVLLLLLGVVVLVQQFL